MKYTKENIFEGIDSKLDELFGGNEITKSTASVFKFLLRDYPIEIEQNILEWVNNEPFSDVDCHGESMKSIIENMRLAPSQIPQLIQNFIDYKAVGFKGSAICYRYL